MTMTHQRTIPPHPFPPRPQPPRQQIKWMNVEEVAKSMRVSKMTVYRLIHAGEIPAVRVGRSFRIQERAVDEYLSGAAVV